MLNTTIEHFTAWLHAVPEDEFFGIVIGVAILLSFVFYCIWYRSNKKRENSINLDSRYSLGGSSPFKHQKQQDNYPEKHKAAHYNSDKWATNPKLHNGVDFAMFNSDTESDLKD